MAYCRWSSNDFQCDLYVYADVMGGYTIHVASNRLVFKEPLPDPVPWPTSGIDDDIGAWMDRHEKIMAMVEAADRVKIDLPHAGKGFYNCDVETAVTTLRMLADLGYVFPVDDIIDCIQEEGENEEIKE